MSAKVSLSKILNILQLKSHCSIADPVLVGEKMCWIICSLLSSFFSSWYLLRTCDTPSPICCISCNKVKVKLTVQHILPLRVSQGTFCSLLFSFYSCSFSSGNHITKKKPGNRSCAPGGSGQKHCKSFLSQRESYEVPPHECSCIVLNTNICSESHPLFLALLL